MKGNEAIATRRHGDGGGYHVALSCEHCCSFRRGCKHLVASTKDWCLLHPCCSLGTMGRQGGWIWALMRTCVYAALLKLQPKQLETSTPQ